MELGNVELTQTMSNSTTCFQGLEMQARAFRDQQLEISQRVFDNHGDTLHWNWRNPRNGCWPPSSEPLMAWDLTSALSASLGQPKKVEQSRTSVNTRLMLLLSIYSQEMKHDIHLQSPCIRVCWFTKHMFEEAKNQFFEKE